MTQLFSNNAVATVNGAITDVATSITVTDGSAMPSPTGGDFFLATLSDGTNIEIVKCTARATNTLTVARAQEGTTGFAFADLDAVELRATAETFATLQRPLESLIIALGDEATAITTGAAKVTFRMPYAFTLTAVRASLTTVSSSGIPTFDVNETGVSILSTKLTIDASEKTSTTAVTAAVMSDTALADDAEITIDIDVAGTGAAGAKIYLIGTRL
jgi:hypothetical protein